MSDNSLTIEIVVPQSPEEVFTAVTNVRAWWHEGLQGESAAAGDQFTFDDGSLRCRVRLTEATPARRVVWHVLNSHLDFIKDDDEWTDTRVIFDITRTPTGTVLRFTHQGLLPTSECYKECSRGWDFYINTSLPDLITTGAGQPITKS